MSAVELIEVQSGSPALRGVLKLHRAAKATLGFLPDEGFTERADAGTLLGAVVDEATVGYVLFDLPGDQVKIRHLCVDPAARGRGVARALVQAVTDRHSDRRGMTLRCRRSYGLEGMWKALGFRPIDDRRGNSRDGSLLTIWEIDFGHPTLFTETPAIGDLACLDQMVFEDLVVERPEGIHSRYLLDDWVEELITLCVTDEVAAESNDTDDPELRRALVLTAASYRNISRHNAPWKRHTETVAAQAPRAGEADHRHVARAIEGGAAYFVSRDEKILEGAEGLKAAFGIVVLTPEALIDRLDRDRRRDRYEPAALQGTSLVQERLPAGELEAFVSALLNTGDGERAHLLRAKLRTALADTARSEVTVVRNATRAIVAGAITTTRDQVLDVIALRVGRDGRLTDTIARQLVFQQRREAADRRLNKLSVSDPKPQAAILRALDAEGIAASPGGRGCELAFGLRDVADAIGPDADEAEVADYERRCWPGKAIGGGLVTWMIAIKPAYAEQLFDVGLAAATLFDREPELGLSRELVYYRSPGVSRSLRSPARILWYVSQEPPGHPVGQVRAVSHLVEVLVDRPRTLHSRFARLGVWSQKEVERVARNGQAMALRFTDTELFAQPPNLSDLRSLFKADGSKFTPPQGPIRVPEHMFCRIYRRSSAYA